MSGALRFTIPGKPVPAPRPRVDRGRVHYSERYNEWREGARLIASSAAANAGWETLAEPCYVCIWLYGWTRGRGDGDNYEKAVWDMLTAAQIIEDDKWVDEWRGFKEKLDSAGPRVTVKVRRLEAE